MGPEPSSENGLYELILLLRISYRRPYVPMFVLGEAGQGKTTLCRQFAHAWAARTKDRKSKTSSVSDSQEKRNLFDDIDLLFAVSLRQVNYQTKTIAELIGAAQSIDDDPN